MLLCRGLPNRPLGFQSGVLKRLRQDRFYKPTAQRHGSGVGCGLEGLELRHITRHWAKGIAARNKKLLGAPGIATRSKDRYGAFVGNLRDIKDACSRLVCGWGESDLTSGI